MRINKNKTWGKFLISFILVLLTKPLHSFDKDQEKGNKLAIVQIGINYIGTPHELAGCGNDILNLFNDVCAPKYFNKTWNATNTQTYTLTDFEGYKTGLTNFLSDKVKNPRDNRIASQFINLDKQSNIPERTHLLVGNPTKNNIEKVLRHIASNNFSDIILQYSGHGGQIRATNDVYEEDGMDEALIPVDVNTKGVITDDWLRQNLILPLYGTKSKNMFILADCCHSASIFDLTHEINPNSNNCKHLRPNGNNHSLAPNVISVSGCKDSQTSADAFINRQSQGALTYNFLQARKKFLKKYPIDVKNFMKEIQNTIKGGFTQQPQLTAEFCPSDSCDTCKDQVCSSKSSLMNQTKINGALWNVFF